jgi:TusA-related sulfurtransferase
MNKTKTTETAAPAKKFVGTISGLHHEEDLLDILQRLKSGEVIEAVAEFYDKRVAVIKAFAEANGVEVQEQEYYDNVEDVLKNLQSKFYNISGDALKDVIQRLLDGDSPSEVGATIGKSAGAVTNFAKANRIRLPEGRRGRKTTSTYTDEQIAKVLELKSQGNNNGAIAHATGIPYNGVVRIVRENNGTTPKEKVELPPKEVLEKMWRDGATQTAMATALKVPLHRIAKAMKDYNLRSAV